MKTKKGFTLIELLVVISIIALLLSILMPALTKVKEQARAVVCLSNIKQIGQMFLMYSVDNKDRLTPGHGLKYENQNGLWPNELGPYYQGANDIRICPSAKKGHPDPQTDADYLGRTFRAASWGNWGEFDWIERGDWFSYGQNNYACDAEEDPAWGVGAGLTSERFPVINYWKKATAKGAINIPLLGDCAWILGGGDSQIPQFITPAEYEDVLGMHWGIELYAINRHGKGTMNMLFLDFSARRLDLKELWTLKWHRNFDTRNPWTLAGGATKARWEAAAPWMAGFKDY